MTEWGGLALAVAVSLDIFAAMSIKGARLRSIHWPSAIGQSLAMAAWQTVVLFLCNQIHRVLSFEADSQEWRIVSVFAFVILAMLTIWYFTRGLGLKRRPAEEYRQERMSAKELLSLAVVTSLDSVVAGIVLGLMDIPVGYSLFAVFGVNVVAMLTGLRLGYARGAQQCYKAYLISGVILLAAAAVLLLKNVIL